MAHVFKNREEKRAYASTVMFSFHAAQRMTERLKVKVPTEAEVDIRSAFFKAKTYRDTNRDQMVEAWASKDRTNKVVLIVSQQSRVVLTVLMGEGLNNGQATPFVESCYEAGSH